jgi:hypothetical protein
MMPSTSKKQHNLMAMVANDPAKAKQLGIPQSVGEDYMQADKGKKFGGGPRSRPDLQGINNPKTRQGKMELFKKGGDAMATKKMNPFAKFEKSGKDIEKKGMKEGSKADMALDKKQMMGMKKGGMKKMAAGGFTKEANGIAKRGLTKGSMVKMNKGGKAC